MKCKHTHMCTRTHAHTLMYRYVGDLFNVFDFGVVLLSFLAKFMNFKGHPYHAWTHRQESADARTHARTHARMHTCNYTRASVHTHAHTCMRAHTHTYPHRALACVNLHAHVHAQLFKHAQMFRRCDSDHAVEAVEVRLELALLSDSSPG